MMVWSEGQTLAARFEQARDAAGDLHRHWKLPQTFSGWSQAIRNKAAAFLPQVTRRLAQQVPCVAPNDWTRHGWVPIAVDGTRLEAPHTQANEDALGCAGRAKSAPQVFLTLLYHMTIGLPLGYRLGPGTDSEQTHMLDMVDQLPPPTPQQRTLLVADCGFSCYELCSRLLAGGQDFLFRIGGNRTLIQGLTPCSGEENRYGLWPEKWQDCEPIVVRLLWLYAEKPHPLFLITNVLDESVMTPAMAAEFYGLRWGEEVFYRTCKQTLDRRTLLSRTPEQCLLEAELLIHGVWLLGLMSVRELGRGGHPPSDWSPAKSRDAVRRALRDTRCRARQGLLHAFSQATKDDYERTRSKAARNYPRKKREQPPSPPKIRAATATELRKLQHLRSKQHNQPLTA